ncbi:MAG: hypothetical protein ABR589_06420 [Chthoniobacterales bacterium]
MKTQTLRSLLVAFCSLAIFSSLDATTVIPPTFDELVGQAELIFEGTVTEAKSQFAGEGGQRHIVTYVTFKVEEAIKGQPGASYTLRMLGGTVDGQTMQVSDSPRFKVGDRDILFVENNGKQFIPLVGIMHGRFRVQKDNQSGAEVVTSDHGDAVTDLAQLGKEDHAGASANAAAARTAGPLRAVDFKAAIRAKLGNSAAK